MCRNHWARRGLERDVKPHYSTPAEAAMRYALSFDAVSVLIPGMKTPEEVDMDIRYSDCAEFPAELMSQCPATPVQGTLLDELAANLIDLERLGINFDQIARFDPTSPLWEIAGADPRLPPPLEKAFLALAMVGATAAVTRQN